MDGGGDGTEKNFGPIPHQTLYESDPSKGLEITRCSNKVPKSVNAPHYTWEDGQLLF